MSFREKKLLFFFALAGFVVLNFLAFGFLKSKRLQVSRAQEQARQELATAEQFQESSQLIADQMEWLAGHEPQPAANQEVQTTLQQLAEREAKAAGLTIKSQKPLPSDSAEGKHYHRAKLQITVTGTEQALYTWFDRINMPDQLRIATQIRMSPDTQDDTKIDCTATIDQWFVPPTL